jgi:hypothetical protein
VLGFDRTAGRRRALFQPADKIVVHLAYQQLAHEFAVRVSNVLLSMITKGSGECQGSASQGERPSRICAIDATELSHSPRHS